MGEKKRKPNYKRNIGKIRLQRKYVFSFFRVHISRASDGCQRPLLRQEEEGTARVVKKRKQICKRNKQSSTIAIEKQRERVNDIRKEKYGKNKNYFTRKERLHPTHTHSQSHTFTITFTATDQIWF